MAQMAPMNTPFARGSNDKTSARARLENSAYRKVYRACKLFDFERMCWTDFDGVPTA